MPRLTDYECKNKKCRTKFFEAIKGDTEDRSTEPCPKCGKHCNRVHNQSVQTRVGLKAKAANVNSRFQDGSYGCG